MPDLRDAERMLEAAEQAAVADDLASADALLREAARIQEAELGPVHPDLANTLNNLAVVAEKTLRFGDAETFYRRAVEIASASLPAGDPMIAASRKNLEDFCRARGLPIETPAVAAPAPRNMEATAPAVPRGASRSFAPAAIGVVVVLAVVTVLVRRPWSPREAPTPTPAVEATTPRQAAEPAQPTPVAPTLPAPIAPAAAAPIGPAQPPVSRPPAAITLATVELCRTFSTSGGSWQCDPAADPVSPGPLVLYTRVRSPRDAVVVHRWYRGDSLRQSVTLTIRSSPTEGYRTYSRQTVDGADWRVEVRTAEGTLLDERRFVVR